MSRRRSRLVDCTGLLLAAVTALQLLSACGGADPQPSSVEDVRGAFANEEIRLAQVHTDFWGTTLVASEQAVRLEVHVLVDPGGARNVAESLEALLRPPDPPAVAGRPPRAPLAHGRVERRANVLVVVPPGAGPALDRRVMRALARLPEG